MKHYTIVIFHALGDCVNSTVLLRPLKEREPCEITWVTHQKYADVVKNNPYVDAVEVFAGGGNEMECDRLLPEIRARQGTHVLTPGPYLTVERDTKGLPDNILSMYVGYMRSQNIPKGDFEPILQLTTDEKEQAEKWSIEHNARKMILLETDFTSDQSFWDEELTQAAIQKIRSAGLLPVIAHPSSTKGVLCADVPYRWLPVLYNQASGFIGVSSGISCIVHTQSCRKDIPHVEFVHGDHWSTMLYPKKDKIICKHRDNALRAIDWLIAKAKAS